MASDLIVKLAVRTAHRVMYVERPCRMTDGSCQMGVIFVTIAIQRLFIRRALHNLCMKK
jgi:hypothetical protein